MTPPFHGKTLDIKSNPFFSKVHEGEYQNTPFFYENANPGFPQKYPFIRQNIL